MKENKENSSKKNETYMQRKLKEYENEVCKTFGTSNLDWEVKLSKLESEVLEAK